MDILCFTRGANLSRYWLVCQTLEIGAKVDCPWNVALVSASTFMLAIKTEGSVGPDK